MLRPTNVVDLEVNRLSMTVAWASQLPWTATSLIILAGTQTIDLPSRTVAFKIRETLLSFI